MSDLLGTAPRTSHGGAPQPRPDFPSIVGQHGLATYRQLRQAGWSEGQIRHARSTVWQCPFPSVVAAHRGPVDATTQLIAATLWAGPRAILSGTSALRLLGLRVPGRLRFVYVVPATGRARRHGIASVVRSAREVPGVQKMGIVQAAPAARALADAAVYEAVAAQDLEALAIAVLQRGLCTAQEMELELWQRPHRKVAGIGVGLAGFLGGAWSRPEAALRRVVDLEPDLPQMLTNIRLERVSDRELVGYPDGFFPDLGLVIQVHSRQHHQGVDDQGGDRWAGTVEKDSAYVAVGARLLGVTPWTLYSQPRRFLTRLRQTVALGPASPMPAVRVVPAPPRGPAQSGQ
ncbi:hypothetical protein [Ornithinimicrobium pratense]|uniref:DUF559 domain-containing protein n=1 Tax=Ornithinimicrobium pratense TaxID=2593973 RepID=A0A5J6V8V2_9MICO|nr:hypothetical protein [Ornithinimicrobium pratense]QFG69533.1 hypothetical protein FY030_13205 [Ornithinimicrobium pratense]